DIPVSIEDSFYQGKVHVGLKDPIFQPSSPMRHNSELYNLLVNDEQQNPFLLIYTDGGPDHRVNYLRVQLSLIALFVTLDLDLLVAVRTPPGHSWKNPVERIMSILNLGLQCVGLMCKKISKEFEQILEHCNSIKDIREAAKNYPILQQELNNILQPVKELLNSIFSHQNLKNEPFTPIN